MNPLADLRRELKSISNPDKAKILSRFFKTGKGEYAEGDIFLGITVPQSRAIAQNFRHLTFAEIKRLLRSKVHEERLIALLILVDIYKNGKLDKQKEIVEYYLSNTTYINNWDLVDLSADKIIGHFLLDKPTTILTKLAKSKSIWERRIAIISTYQFIKNNKFDETLKIGKILLNDKHDLIQKAVGWMLREVGKRSFRVEEQFLKKYYKKMPRTMLRYAIEKFPDKLRKNYLLGKI